MTSSSRVCTRGLCLIGQDMSVCIHPSPVAFFPGVTMLCTLFLLLLALGRVQTTRPCFPGCQCEEETFGLFDSFSLIRVDCSSLGPHIVPVPIPLDTAHLDLSSNRLETVNESVLGGPGYTTLAGLDLSHNLLTSSIMSRAFSHLHYLESFLCP